MHHRRAAPELMAAGSRTGTVLVVEDEPIIAFALEDMLLELGFEQVLLAGSLKEARQLIEASALSAAILDVNIHGHQSYPLATELRERAVPFIFATGYGDAQHPQDLCGVATLTKPYNFTSLEKALGEAGI